ncbi:MAG: hypothetical protein Ct9H300mP12_05910 [Acidimicrobiales bacterium]|nr:MAG: hypothetical protein Ct9H300mP12_05910 [Acidimicrobiales bacterium]
MPVATVNGAEISVTEDGGSVSSTKPPSWLQISRPPTASSTSSPKYFSPRLMDLEIWSILGFSAGEFPTLIAAVQAAGLVDTLKSEGPFTVFAPTEAAFAAA